MADDGEKKPSFVDKMAKRIVITILSLIGAIVVAFIVTSVLKYQALRFSPEILTDPLFLTFVVVAILLLIVWGLTNMTKSKDGSNGAKIKNKGGIKKYYDSKWITAEELKTNSAYKFHYYTDLSKSDNIGIPIRAEVVNGKMLVNMYDSIHTLVIGTTGSGKTTQFVDPTIQIFGESHSKPCMVITDPKGELYDNHSAKLRKRGYRIIVLDLKEPFKSTCWNPMTRPYDLNKRANNLEKELLVHRGDDPRSYPKLRLADNAYYSEWYEFDGIAFADINMAKTQMEGLRQQLKIDAVEELKDIATVLCPIENQNDPIWERGAKDFILAIMLAMLEDSENPDLGMTREKFNFYNLSKIANLKDADPFNPTKTLTDYFAGRDPLSQATQLANQVITNADTTQKSYMGVVSDRMGLFSDLGICYATHINEMQLSNFTDEPTALFIKIPDEKVTRHPIASMFISQLYKILVDSANKNGGKLKRNVYFILDEFANMPAIQNFETIITVARSRKIFFILILQSYTQLAIKYKDTVASTVKDNCNIHIYIASNDAQTQKEFSDRCGTITVETETTTSSKGKKDDQSTTTTSLNIDSRPLIYPAELGSLKDELIVSILKQQPLRARFTPSYKPEARKFYDMTPAEEEFVPPKLFDEHGIYYDIKRRNQIVLNNGGSNNSQKGSDSNFNFNTNFDDYEI